MMLDVDALPFVQARWYTKTSGRVIDYVVLHDMEFPERPDSAEWCANFFATSDRQGSAHCCVDNDSIVRSVLDKDVAWGANGVNHNGLHIEHAGYASQTSGDWADDYSVAMLARSANLTAAWCQRYDIPTVFVDHTGLMNGARGITTHREAEIAFPYGGHSDPGPNFPIDGYIDMVRGLIDMTPEELGLIRDPNNPGNPVYGVMLMETIPDATNPQGTFKWYPYNEAIVFIHQAGKTYYATHP